MSIAGNLKTMDLAELLQWLSQSQKTGTLVIDNGKIEKRLCLRGGRIVSSASTDPKEYLGHFLVSQGFIDEEQLDRAVKRQASEKMLLGKILLSDGAIKEDDLQRLLQLKAEESIYDTFTWEDGEFRFLQDELPERIFVPSSLDLTGVLMEGARRVDEWNRIRKVIPDLASVPVAITELEDPTQHPGVQRILSCIDDDSTIEEIQEETHSTAFFVCSVLFDLVKNNKVKVVRPRIVRVEVPVEVPQPQAPPGGPVQQQTPPPQPVIPPGQGWGQPQQHQQHQQHQQPYGPPPQAPPYPHYGSGQMPPSSGTMTVASPPPPGNSYGGYPQGPGPPPASPSPPAGSYKDADPDQLEPAALILAASENIADREFERAMRYLRAAKSVRPDDRDLQSKVRTAEQQIRTAIEQSGLTSEKVPKLAVSMDQLTTLNVSAQEGFILTRIDGSYNLKSILKISSMPEIDALILFDRMLKAGYISI